MPKFFLPFAETAEQAEETYQGFVKTSSTYPLTDADTRLFRIAFEHHGTDYLAEVGKEISNWPEAHGPVLAIIETEQLVVVHTQRSALAGDRINVNPSKISERAYFDDYQPRSRS